MEILELVGSRELLHIEAVGKHAVGFPLEEMLTFVSGDVGDGGEHIGGVRSSALDTVSVVDSTLSSFCVDIEELQVIVKIDRASAQVATQEGSVGGEDGGDIDAPLLAEGESDTSEPLVELSNDGSLLLVKYVLGWN
jgi:hypothetical protein